MESQEGKGVDRNGQLCWREVEWGAEPAPVSQDTLLPTHRSASPTSQMLEPQGWYQPSLGGMSALPLTSFVHLSEPRLVIWALSPKS